MAILTGIRNRYIATIIIAHHWQSQYNRHLNSLSTPANSISLANSIWSLCENFFDIPNCCGCGANKEIHCEDIIFKAMWKKELPNLYIDRENAYK